MGSTRVHENVLAGLHQCVTGRSRANHCSSSSQELTPHGQIEVEGVGETSQEDTLLLVNVRNQERHVDPDNGMVANEQRWLVRNVLQLEQLWADNPVEHLHVHIEEGGHGHGGLEGGDLLGHPLVLKLKERLRITPECVIERVQKRPNGHVGNAQQCSPLVHHQQLNSKALVKGSPQARGDGQIAKGRVQCEGCPNAERGVGPALLIQEPCHGVVDHGAEEELPDAAP
mmetsp:Transcript_2504/g.8910  ORF Transcript_2504/g.8910 Transcript_2504/m.8910 type:complete len:228 (+) Transcript_2504:549-1232(+)